jgi:hypothetical protein
VPEFIVKISGLSPDDIARVKDLPHQIETLLQQAQSGLDAIQSGGASGNPFGAFLGSLSTLATDVGKTPGIESVLNPIKELMNSLPSADLANVNEIAGSIEQVLEFLGPFKDTVLSGSLEQTFQEALTKGLDVIGSMTLEKEKLSGANEDIKEFFRLFHMMVNWKNSTPRPEDVVDFLSRVLLGLPPDLLAQPLARLEQALTPLSNALPRGPDLTAWRQLPELQLAFWQQINVRFDTPATINWPALLVDLQSARQHLLDSIALRDRLLSVTISSVNRVEFGGLADVAASLSQLPAVKARQFSSVLEGMRADFETLIQKLESWNPTPEDTRSLVREFVDSILDSINQTPLGQLRIVLINFQQRFLRAIEELPFRDLAHEAEKALHQVAKAIDILDPETIRRPVHEFFDGVRGKISDFSADEIRHGVEQLWQNVEATINQVSALIDNLRTTIEGAVSHLQTFVESAKPTIEDISSQVETIKAQLESFDLNEPAASIIDELHDLRDTVAQLDVSKLPSPAVATLKAGAELLRAVDITAAVKDPVNTELAKIDPTEALKNITASLGGVVVDIKALDPGSLAANLDKPVDELLKGLAQLGPQQLRKLIEEAIEPVEDAIREIDFGVLLAPLTEAFGQIKARVDALLNPDVIFKPLEELYKPVIDVIDALNPKHLLDFLEPHSGAIGAKVGEAAGPPSTFTAASDTLKEAFAGGLNVSDELFGFRPGDLLIPIIDLHHKLSENIESLADSVLSPAASLLHSSLYLSLQNLSPSTIQSQIQTSLAGINAEFDTIRISSRLADAVLAYHAAAGKINGAAQLELSTTDRTAATASLTILSELNPLRLVPDAEQSAGVQAATVHIEANVEMGELRNGFAVAGPSIEALLPPFLKTAELGAADLRQALRDLNPAPIREEINALFDTMGRKLAGLQNVLMAALDELMKAIEEFILPITPANILRLGQQLHAAAKEQILLLSPAAFKDEVKEIFDVVKQQLAVFDPVILINEFNDLREQIIQSLRALLAGLVPDSKAFDDLQVHLAKLKPSELLKGLSVTLKPVTDLVSQLDPNALLAPLLDAIAHIREQIPDVLAKIEAAFDDVLAAFPEGGAGSVSVSAQVQVG